MYRFLPRLALGHLVVGRRLLSPFHSRDDDDDDDAPPEALPPASRPGRPLPPSDLRASAGAIPSASATGGAAATPMLAPQWIAGWLAGWRSEEVMVVL